MTDASFLGLADPICLRFLTDYIYMTLLESANEGSTAAAFPVV